eukprot:6059221-Alexandrium_andersonii.AAC.1
MLAEHCPPKNLATASGIMLLGGLHAWGMSMSRWFIGVDFNAFATLRWQHAGFRDLVLVKANELIPKVLAPPSTLAE